RLSHVPEATDIVNQFEMEHQMKSNMIRYTVKRVLPASLSVLLLSAAPLLAQSQDPAVAATRPLAVPDWAYPNSPTHKQVPPPPDFHRPSRNFDTPIGIFEGQSDIGSALVPANASFDAGAKAYTIHSAGYNVW